MFVAFSVVSCVVLWCVVLCCVVVCCRMPSCSPVWVLSLRVCGCVWFRLRSPMVWCVVMYCDFVYFGLVFEVALDWRSVSLNCSDAHIRSMLCVVVSAVVV